MQKAKPILRYIFGGLWLLFGLNFFFHFLSTPPPAEPALNLIMALVNTGYFMVFVKIVEIVAGILLVTNLFVPLALVIIAPVSLNIFLIHLMLDPAGILPALVMVALNVTLGWLYIDSYRSMLKMKT